MRIKIKNSDTFVILEGYNGAVESHPVLTDFPDVYELTNDEPTESSSYFVCTYKGDPKLAPDYYLVREAAGKELVNEISNELLRKYKSGEMALAEVISINDTLEGVTNLIGGGRFIIAQVKLSPIQSVPSDMKIYIATRLQQLIAQHY